MDTLRVLRVIALLGRDPALHQAIAHGERQAHVAIAIGGDILILRQRIEQVVGEGVEDGRGFVGRGGARRPPGDGIHSVAVSMIWSDSWQRKRMAAAARWAWSQRPW